MECLLETWPGDLRWVFSERLLFHLIDEMGTLIFYREGRGSEDSEFT